jgi:hypothetical protein
MYLREKDLKALKSVLLCAEELEKVAEPQDKEYWNGYRVAIAQAIRIITRKE